MYILGIDPGTIRCGYGIIQARGNKFNLEEAGFIEFASSDLQDIILKLDEELDKIFASFDINEVAIENIFYAYNPKSFIKLSQFRGAVCMKVLQTFGSFSEYTPLQVKQAVVGNGKSKKEQVAFMVSKIFGLKEIIKPFDVSDAIAVALTHAQRCKL